MFAQSAATSDDVLNVNASTPILSAVRAAEFSVGTVAEAAAAATSVHAKQFERKSCRKRFRS